MGRELWDKGSSWVISCRQFISLEISVPLEGWSSSVPSAVQPQGTPRSFYLQGQPGQRCPHAGGGTVGAPAPGGAPPARGPARERGKLRTSNLWQPHSHSSPPFPQLGPSTDRSAGPPIRAGPCPSQSPATLRNAGAAGQQGLACLGTACCLMPPIWSMELGMGAAPALGWGRVRPPGATGPGPCRVLGSVPVQTPAGWSCQGTVKARIWGFWRLWAGGGMKQASKIKDTAPINH